MVQVRSAWCHAICHASTIPKMQHYQINYFYSRILQNLAVLNFYDTKEKSFWTEKKLSHLIATYASKVFQRIDTKFCLSIKPVRQTKPIFLNGTKRSKTLKCDVCFKCLSDDPIAETKFNLSDNFSDLFFWFGCYWIHFSHWGMTSDKLYCFC